MVFLTIAEAIMNHFTMSIIARLMEITIHRIHPTIIRRVARTPPEEGSDQDVKIRWVSNTIIWFLLLFLLMMISLLVNQNFVYFTLLVLVDVKFTLLFKFYFWFFFGTNKNKKFLHWFFASRSFEQAKTSSKFKNLKRKSKKQTKKKDPIDTDSHDRMIRIWSQIEKQHNNVTFDKKYPTRTWINDELFCIFPFRSLCWPSLRF